MFPAVPAEQPWTLVSPDDTRAGAVQEKASAPLSNTIKRFDLDLDSDAMQDAAVLLRQSYSTPVCIEDLDFELGKDNVTLKQALEQLEQAGKVRQLSGKERSRLAVARRLRREGKPDGHSFDINPRYTGHFTASTLEGLLTEVTTGTPYTWRKIRQTYLLHPRTSSLLAYPVTLDTKGLNVDEAVTKVLDQKPDAPRIGRMQVYIGPVGPGQNPFHWLKAKLPPLQLKDVPAREALCIVTEASKPRLFWHVEGFKGSRHLSLTDK